MKINIYYGGRGLVDDPTNLVLDKMQAVLEELNVSVERFNLYELRGALTTLPQTLKSADGIILATTLESAAICRPSWMRSGYTGIRKRSAASICVPS